MTDWHSTSFAVGMPHTAPGGRLSEVELLKLLGDVQWKAIARVLGRPASRIVNEMGERLYSSFIDVEFDLASHSLEALGEDTTLNVRNRLGLFGERYAEGLFVFDAAEISDSDIQAVKTRRDLSMAGRPWAYITNAFVARGSSNTALRIFRPSGIEDVQQPALSEAPEGLAERKDVENSGRICFDDAGTEPIPLALTATGDPARPGVVTYPITPESDLNGAGLFYFARYVAAIQYGERRALTELLEPPLSASFVSHLSTRRRKIYYFANAGPHDEVRVSTRVGVRCAGSFTPSPPSARHRQPLELVVRSDLRRVSDKVLMASSLAEQSLNVPADERAVLVEARRFASSLSAGRDQHLE